MTLDAAGITRIDLKYIRDNRQDAFGNLFRFKSRVWIANGHGSSHPSATYDVFFNDK